MTKIQSNLQDSISRIISGSLQAGGSLVFLEENGVVAASAFWQILTQEFVGRISFRSCSHILWETRGQGLQSKDVLFVGPNHSQKDLQSLATQVSCRVIVEDRDLDSSLGDGFWDANDWSADRLRELVNTALSAVREKGSSRGALAKAVFLDRDDVIVRNVPYNKDPAKVVLMPGIGELIQAAHLRGELVLICSNQSGLGRGMISFDQYRQVHQQMLALLAQQGAWVDDCFWASYIEGSVLENYELEPQMRKPRPGMFVTAAAKWNIAMDKSCMIGDSATDLIAAYRAGVGHLYLLSSEKTASEKQSLDVFQKEHPDFKYHFLPELSSFNS